jgi:hypothetical protein
MYISFDSLPNNAKIWIYQANRTLTEQETMFVKNFLTENIDVWASHGASLKGGFNILHNRFIVIGVDVDYNNASGCSIDTSSRWIKEINAKFNIDFFDRSLAYLQNDVLSFLPILGLKKYVESGLIRPETIVFNNQVQQKSEIDSNWKIYAKDSFLARYFNLEVGI